MNLTLRTEYSFRFAIGKLDEVISRCSGDSVGIADRNGTWGHIAFRNAAIEAGKKPIFGVELAVVEDAENREEKAGASWFRFIALTTEGLQDIYQLVELATENFYYFPRISYADLEELDETKVAIITGHAPRFDLLGGIADTLYFPVSPRASKYPKARRMARELGLRPILSDDNYYPAPEDSGLYGVVVGDLLSDELTHAQHILSPDEAMTLPDYFEGLGNACELSEKVEAEIPFATMVKPKTDKTLLELCKEGAGEIDCDLSDPVYLERLERELLIIHEKEFEDYFFVVGDLVREAKKTMLVGPARGSSCGSLVCYLLGITTVDPIEYDLLFERFIDLNRADYPDIDIDFPDSTRERVFDYLVRTYGADCVSRLGTVNFFKPRSALVDVSKALRVPSWRVEKVKEALSEGSSSVILDTFRETEIGRDIISMFPSFKIASRVEGRARHAGIHAAAILVTNDPITRYGSVDTQSGALQMDKIEAEGNGLLKIDALGLRTLSVIQDVIDQVGMTPADLYSMKPTDERAFAVLNYRRFSGIFQFEGDALINLVSGMKVEEFEDIVAITALARPGPLMSGGAKSFVLRRSRKEKVRHLHKLIEPITRDTQGIIVFQEQVMKIVREVGGLSWEDVSRVRKAMSKSKGKAVFDELYPLFESGAIDNGLEEDEAKEVWSNIESMGAWAFNRSHAVAYGLVSYWTLYLKALHPLEFAAATLRHAKDEDQSRAILRELVKEGYSYVAKDKDRSGLNWTAEGSELVGPLTGIKGIGPKLAAKIIAKRDEGKQFTAREITLLTTGVTPYDDVFETGTLWGHLYDDPVAYDIARLWKIEEITEDLDATVVFIGRTADRRIKDANEPAEVAKRDGKILKGQTKSSTILVEDDTGTMRFFVNRDRFLKLGKKLVEEHPLGSWFIFKGKKDGGKPIVWGDIALPLTDNERFKKK